MTQIEQIKAEIERLNDKYKHLSSVSAKHKTDCYTDLLSFINSLPDETSEDMEQKPTEWSDEDEKPYNNVLSGLKYAYEDLINNKSFDSAKDIKEAFDWMQARVKNFCLQPKSEWSEEDEDMLNSCISSIEEAKENRYAYKETDGDTSYDHEIDWLKSLRPQPRGIYQQVVKGLRDMCDRYEQNGMFTDERARDFLGNVRVKCKDAIECALILDEPSWKPSEVQMEALAWYSGNSGVPPTGDKAIKSLYNDLKKL